MRKRISIAGLGIRLTAGNAFWAIVLCSAVQIWLFWRTQYMWQESAYSWSMAFEWLLDNERVGLMGKLSFIGILAAVVWPCAAGRTRLSYTLGRLRIGENEITAIWALIFSGYFLISWGVQLVLVLGMFARYAQVTGWGKMELFVTAYNSSYFHTLLPLSEPWAFVRNIVLCLSWGAMGSLLSRYIRRGGTPFMAIALIVVSAIIMPTDVATDVTDIFGCLFLLVVIICQVIMIREVEKDAD